MKGDCEEKPSALVERILLYKSFVTLSIEDQMSLIIANWNRAMIIYLLLCIRDDNFSDEDELEPIIIEVGAAGRDEMTEDDRPIVDSVITQLFPQVTQFGLFTDDLEYLLANEILDTSQLFDKKINEVKLKEVYVKAVGTIDYIHRNYRKMCKVRRKARDISRQCKKHLFWEKSVSELASWLEQQLTGTHFAKNP